MPEQMPLTPRERLSQRADRRLQDAKVAGVIAIGLYFSYGVVDTAYLTSENQIAGNLALANSWAFWASTLMAAGNFSAYRIHKKSLKNMH